MKVLVVDDSKTCRILYRRELQSGGYDVVEAKDGVEALKIVTIEPIDLVVLDIEMPNMNGYEVCERLRSEEFTNRFTQKREGVLPVIFVTSNESVEWRVKGFSKGANGFINKGFKPGTLLSNVDDILKPQNPLAGLKALVVEDSRFLRNMITAFLKEQRIAVVVSDSCERAFEMLMHGTDVFDFVVTALEMPGMNGDQFCKHIRTDLGLKTLPLLVLTESDDRRMLVRLFESGATDYLIKPFEKEELVARVKASLEIVNTLKQEVERRVWERTAEQRGEETPMTLEQAVEQAKLATSVLHNIGNVLNSVFACCYQLGRIIKDSKLRQLILAHELIESNRENLGDFITNDPRGKLLPEYLIKSGKRVSEEHMDIAREIEEMANKINLMKDIIETQQMHAKQVAPEPVQLVKLMEDAFKVQQENIEKNKVQVIRDYSESGEVKAHRVTLTHVLINLIKNAVEAMRESTQRELTLQVGRDASGKSMLSITDTGVGISNENLTRIFEHGFTTKIDGHGFGLAFCHKAIRDVGGELTVHSEGEGKGATFSMIFGVVEPQAPKAE